MHYRPFGFQEYILPKREPVRTEKEAFWQNCSRLFEKLNPLARPTSEGRALAHGSARAFNLGDIFNVTVEKSTICTTQQMDISDISNFICLARLKL